MEEIDKITKAERRIQSNLFDVEPWTILIRDSQIKKIDDARIFYEKLVDQFPNCGRFWKIYIEHEMKARNYDKVEKLFQRCLMKIFHIDLWKLYLAYIKETKVGLPTYREKMAQAYDFALDKIGIDINSYQIWADYITFLKSVEAVGTYAENHRILVVRKIFQKAIINPMYNVETVWRDYCIFESSINPLISKKMQEERLKDHTNAKRVAKEYEMITKGLNKNIPSVPPQNTPEDLKQIELWRKYISWEKSNPLQTDDQLILTKRVIFAYEQCLLCLGYHPDVWLEAASFLEKASKLLIEKGADAPGKMYADEAAALYERAINTFLKNSILIYLAYADFEETRMKYDKVHIIYKKALELPNIDPTIIYIQYMKFARRAEGIKTARNVFKMAREDSRSKYHIYIAASLMEHYCSKESAVALRIFELAFKKYGDEINFIKEYLTYTSQLNEDNNTRVLFERVLSSGHIPNEKTLPIWNLFLEFEANVGDLSTINKIEKRMTQALANETEGNEALLLINRYKYLDLLPCQPAELKALGYKDQNGAPAAQAPSTDPNEIQTLAPSTVTAYLLDDNSHPSKMAVPDVTQLLPFKPKRERVALDYHLVPGGVFPPPPAATDLMVRLPPPFCFGGPFVMIDKLIEHFLSLEFPEDYSVFESNGCDRKIDPGTQLSIDISLGRKRRLGDAMNFNDDSEGEDSLMPPVNDVYRQRQQKKVK